MTLTKNEIDKTLLGEGVNTYNRFQVFLDKLSRLTGENYWYALRNAYTDSDNLFRLNGLVKAAFLKEEPNRNHLMDSNELNYLESLPDKIKIYRGMTVTEFDNKSYGISWTLKKEVAEFFARTYCRNHSTNHIPKMVQEITINKSEIIAFLNNREEFEIIYINRKESNTPIGELYKNNEL